jgi:tetratricopeptide (TPR) repeat protein
MTTGMQRCGVSGSVAGVSPGAEQNPACKSEARNPKSEGNPKPETRSQRRTCAHLVALTHGAGLWLAFLVVGFLPFCTQAAPSAAAFDAANKLYEEGKFAEAVSAYEKLGQTGQVSAALYFNLGNSYFKSGQIGRAIAAYRTAQQITPRDPDVRANLQFARNQTPSPTLSPSRWQRWLARLTLNEWTLLAAGAVWLWLLLLAILQWRPALRPVLRSYVFSVAVVGALLCICVLAALRETRFTRTAIVVTGEATARYGPLAESPAAFTVHDGAELRVLDQKDDWLQVSAGPRRIGWLRRDQTLLLSGKTLPPT